MNLLPLKLASPASGSGAEAAKNQEVDTKKSEFDDLVKDRKDTAKASKDDKEVTPDGPTAQATMLDLIATLLPATLATPTPVLTGEDAFAFTSVTGEGPKATNPKTDLDAAINPVVPQATATQKIHVDFVGVDGKQFHGKIDAPVAPPPVIAPLLDAKAAKQGPAVTDLTSAGTTASPTIKDLLHSLDATKVVVESTAQASKGQVTSENVSSANPKVRAVQEPIAVQSTVQVAVAPIKKADGIASKQSANLKVNATIDLGALQTDTEGEDKPAHKDEDKPRKDAFETTSTKQPDLATPRVTKAETESIRSVGRQIADQIRDLMDARRPGKVTIILEPAHLGTVTVTVRQAGGRFSADIQASDAALRQQLSDNKTELIKTAESRGMTMDSFNVGQQSQQDKHQATHQELQRTANLATTNPTSEQEQDQPATTYARRNDHNFETTA